MTRQELAGAQGVLGRVFGPDSERFELELDSSARDRDVFEVEARVGTVTVRATSPVALCRGAYVYARSRCHRQMTWSGDAMQLPSPLPDCPPLRSESRVANRHYLSVCTFGYSACWWDWDRWERELDWMALHGVNQPLLLAGQEAVSRRVFLRLGLGEREIADHFSGPAYLWWHRLGNLNGHMGPLSSGWIESQENLQRKILDRARELGMRPIVPGFSGFVPAGLQRLRPAVRLMSAEPWAGFEATTYIDPRCPAFVEIGRAYMDEYRRTYGPAGYFLCELFAEQVPCLDPATELEELRATGEAIWETLTTGAVHPPSAGAVGERPDESGCGLGATWVMQGWPFYFARDYWTPERTEALLSAAPAGRVVILDLATEELETWRLQPAMREKGWMFNVVHNYGQNTHLHGDLRGFVDRAHAMLADPAHGRLLGMGISPEGIDQNPIVYELLTDLPWSGSFTSLNEWVRDYARSRYGQPNDAAERAWAILSEAVYGREFHPHPRYRWHFRPGDQPLVASPDLNAVGSALAELLNASDDLGESGNFRRDLVDVAKTWLGGIADRLLETALETLDPTTSFEALADLDRLLATRPEHRLSTWLGSARKCGTTAAESNLLERNARALITYWGGPFLFDYATREWAGLTLDFHLERWRLWFDHLANAFPQPDYALWEREWADRSRPPDESVAGSEIDTVRSLVTKYRPLDLAPDPPIEVHRLEPRPLTGGCLTVEFPEPRTLIAAACVPVFGQGSRSRCFLEVGSVGRWIPVESYFGAEEASRGMRFRFPPRAVDALRFRIEVVLGSKDQLFQAVTFASPR